MRLSNNWEITDDVTVHRVFFALCNFCLATLQFAPSKFTQTRLCLKRDNMTHWSLPSLKFAAEKEGKMDENELGINISLIQYF